MELAFLSAVEQARLVRSGELSSTELVEHHLERIERLDPTLNSFVTVCGNEALEAAALVDSSPGDAPFRGVPIAIKDLAPTAGIRTTYSSRAFADNVPDFDSAVVRRIREAGFVIVGKTNTPEFGTVAFTESELNGATRNPWNTALTPGGSSGGAAAALAAGLVPAAHATDGGGSVRIPASCCGLFGLKPSRGRVSSAPFGSFEGFSTAGPLTRTVEDAAHILDVLAGYEPGDPWWAPPPERPFAETVAEAPPRLRIAVTSTPPIDVAVDSECIAAVTAAAALLADLGHDVREATPPWREPSLFDTFIAVWQVGPALHPVEDIVVADDAEPRTHRGGARRDPQPAMDAPLRRCRSWPAGSSRSGMTSTSCSRQPSRCRRFRSGGRTRWTAPSSSSCAIPSSRRSPPSRTSRGSRQCRCHCTGAKAAFRSASRRSARRPATRSS